MLGIEFYVIIKKTMRSSNFIGGLAGATAMTLLHESVKRIVPNAPRMDLLGMNAISKGLKSVDAKVPDSKKLYTIALAGDLLTNSLYYTLSAIGKPKNIWVRSGLLGFAAGLSAVMLPERLGLNEKHSNRTLSTKLMTIGIYMTGALVSAAVIKLMEKKKAKREVEWERRLVTSSMG
jgi:hypothetical protein